MQKPFWSYQSDVRVARRVSVIVVMSMMGMHDMQIDIQVFVNIRAVCVGVVDDHSAGVPYI